MENSLGWIKVHRKLTESAVWTYAVQAKYPSLTHFFLHLLLSVNYEDKKWFDGKEEVTVPIGSLVTSLENLAKETGLSVQTIRTCLSHLQNMGILTCTATNKWTQIFIVNWGKYQGESVPTNTPSNNPATNNQQTSNKRVTTTKEYKKERRDIPSLEGSQNESAKTSFVPCTEDELYHIAKTKRVGWDTVRKKQQEILAMVESGEMAKKYKKNTSTYNTLMSWLEIDKKKGWTAELDDMGMMLLEHDTPEQIARDTKAIETMKRMEAQGGGLYAKN